MNRAGWNDHHSVELWQLQASGAFDGRFGAERRVREVNAHALEGRKQHVAGAMWRSSTANAVTGCGARSDGWAPPSPTRVRTLGPSQ